MDDLERQKLINSWIIYQTAFQKGENCNEGSLINEDHWWSIDKLFGLAHDNPEELWVIILAILEQVNDTGVLGMLSASPLEDLIHYHGPDFIDRIEEQAHKDNRFKQLLRGVWQSSSKDVWDRIHAVMQ